MTEHQIGPGDGRNHFLGKVNEGSVKGSIEQEEGDGRGGIIRCVTGKLVHIRSM